MNLSDILRRHEGKTLEFKRDLSSPVNVLRTIVAFANSAGGVLVIGVEDGSRRVIGVKHPLEEQERLTNLISTSIAGPLLPSVEVLAWRDKNLVAAEIFPSSLRPHHLLSEGAEMGAYVRVGASNRRADRLIQDDLRRTARNESFDEIPIPELNSEAIDFRVASECFAPVRKLSRKHLESLHLLVPHQGRMVPSNAAILLFGKERAAHFPDAWIQAGRFSGTTRTNIVDSREFHDSPVRAVVEAMEFVRKHAQLAYRIEGARHDKRWSLPLAAIREAVVNAVVHADYSQRGAPLRVLIFDDRVIVESPGLLPFGLTIEDIQNGVSRLRNRVIGRVFKELGLIEQWGSGVGRMIDACREGGLPLPRFEESGLCFQVTFPLQVEQAPHHDDINHRILKAIADADGIKTRDVAEAARLTTRAVRSRLKKLVERGFVVEIGSGPNDPHRSYFITKRRNPPTP